MSDAMVLVLTVGGAYRLWRLLAIDKFPPFQWARRNLERAIHQAHGAVWAAGVSCAFCSGAWASIAVVGAVWATRPLPLPGLWFAAVSTAVGLLAQRDDVR